LFAPSTELANLIDMKPLFNSCIVALFSVCLIGCASSSSKSSSSPSTASSVEPTLPTPGEQTAGSYQDPYSQVNYTADTGTVPTQTTPSTPSASASTETGATTEYTIRNGDSLWKIARAHNTNVEKIRQLNSLANDKIRAGDKLLVPATTSTGQ